jgi:hypothetical protein
MHLDGPIRASRHAAVAVCVAFLAGAIGMQASPAQTSISASERVTEVVATLASGQVTVVPAHDGVVITAIGNEFEPDDLPPLIVPVSSHDAVVVLGAADWFVPPPRSRTLLRLDSRIPMLLHGITGNRPSLNSGAGFENLDEFGLAVLTPLRQAARSLHARVRMPQDVPLAELLVIHEEEGSSPAVWDLSYWLHQTFLQENFWDTEIERPAYNQLLPSKQDASETIEIRYPPGNSSMPGVLHWLNQPTGPIVQEMQTDRKLAKAERDVVAGKPYKAHLAQLVPLVQAALESAAGTRTKVMAVIGRESGFSWVIAPPASARPPANAGPKRPAGAPTLRVTPHGF